MIKKKKECEMRWKYVGIWAVF